jgi:hypothetical protein
VSEVFNPNKPKDDEMVAVVARYFGVGESVAVAWLKQVDHRSKSPRTSPTAAGLRTPFGHA